MSASLNESAHRIFREMMVHPVLFTHPNPSKIAIIGDEDNSILHEVLKHTQIRDIHHVKINNSLMTVEDARVKVYVGDQALWATTLPTDSMDILINAAETTSERLQSYYQLLNNDGILVGPGESPFYLHKLKLLAEQLQIAGFRDLQILHFPQPSYSSGWQTALMALKQGIFKRIREKAVFNKTFKTHYYNFDIHKASTVLPEFMRDEWIM